MNGDNQTIYNTYIQDININDVANGEGVRVTIWVSGCFIHCDGCFNKQAWDYNSGRLFTKNDFVKITSALSNPLIKGITIMGGEPLAIDHNNEKETLRNAFFTLSMIHLAKSYKKNVWVYTGSTIEKLIEQSKKYKVLKDALDNIDVLVDGPYMKEKHDNSTNFYGSSNQRIIRK